MFLLHCPLYDTFDITKNTIFYLIRPLYILLSNLDHFPIQYFIMKTIQILHSQFIKLFGEEH
jgi:hypothetical protein